MKALTICQPYVEMVLLGYWRFANLQDPIETYRGPLLLHAASSHRCIRFDYDGQRIDSVSGKLVDDLTFSAIVGRANLVACIPLAAVNAPEVRQRCPGLAGQKYARGPFLAILDAVERLEAPIEYRGQQGLYDIPDAVLVNAAWKAI